jgi:hypothetical protein
VDTTDQFKQAEDQYNHLKEQRDSGVITEEQFNEAVKRLTVKDSQGHIWIMGDNGYWAMRESPASLPSPNEEEPRSVSAPTATYTTPRVPGLAVILVAAAGLIALVCLLGVGGLFLATNASFLKVGLAPNPTSTPLQAPTLPADAPTMSSDVPTAAPLPTATTLHLPDFAIATTVPALLTATPTVEQPAGITPAPPGLYVTDIHLDPTAPARRQDIHFYAVFLNTTGSTTNLRWKALVYKADNTKNSLGETGPTLSEIPSGQGEQKTSSAWRLVGGGGCENFIARIVAVDDKNKTKFVLNKPDGTPFEISFSVC